MILKIRISVDNKHLEASSLRTNRHHMLVIKESFSFQSVLSTIYIVFVTTLSDIKRILETFFLAKNNYKEIGSKTDNLASIQADRK